jgi:arylsulfatase A-like enzyme
MIRSGDWKLCYYHGQEPQLFHLADDPHELHDRAGDPDCRAVREELIRRVLEDWAPERIAAKMAAKRDDLPILRAWARHTAPLDQYRWPLLPEMDYLE